MSDCIEIIQGRRSIRRYLPKDISDETLQNVLEAARWAPSWANSQCWELVLVKDQGLKKDLQNIVSERNPATNAIIDAPVLIALCGKLKSSGYYKGSAPTKFGDWFMFDLGLICQTICLAAHANGLGTVVVGLFDHDKAGEIIKLPNEHEVVALIPMGYSDQQPSPPKRKEVTEFCHINTFNKK